MVAEWKWYEAEMANERRREKFKAAAACIVVEIYVAFHNSANDLFFFVFLSKTLFRVYYKKKQASLSSSCQTSTADVQREK